MRPRPRLPVAAWCRSGLLCAGLLIQAVSASIEDGLRFHLSFESDPAQAAFAQGRPDARGKPPARIAGRVGRGAQVGPDGLSFLAAGNFVHARGSLALWVRVPAACPAPAQIKFVDAQNFELREDPQTKRVLFMTGKTLPVEGYRWDYGTAVQLPAPLDDTWRHLAVTWDAASGEKRLYLDGQVVSSGRTDLLRETSASMETPLRFGGGAPVDLDEIYIWDRVLSAAEIRAVFEKGEELSTRVAALPRAVAPASWPLDVGLCTTPLNQAESTIVAPGEAFAAEIPLRNPSAQAWAGTATFTVENFFGEILETRREPLALDASAGTSLRLQFRPTAQGIYRVGLRLEGTGADPAALKDVASFVVWPAGARLPDDSWFGVHANSWAGGAMVRQAARLGFRHNRNHNMLQTTWWPRVQPEPGAFQWRHDPSLQDNLDAGFSVLGQFFGTPWWAARGGELPRQAVSAGDSAYPYGAVPRLEAFETYVTETVNRYKDRIHRWEIGNEPDVSMFWRGTPEEFAELVRVAATATHRADPAATVLAAGFAANLRFAEAAAQAGALRPIDALSIHIYHPVGAAPETLLERFETRLAFFRDLLARYSDRPDMPVHQSEGGSESTTFLRGLENPAWPPAAARPAPNWRAAAIRQVQSDVLLKGLGFASSYSYLWNGARTYSNLSELDLNTTPKPKAVARAALAAEIDGCVFVEHLRRPEGRFWAALFSNPRDHSTRAVLWAGDGARLSLPADALGRDPVLRNLMGAPLPSQAGLVLTDLPIFLRTASSATDLATRLKTAALTVQTEATPLPVTVTVDAQDADLPALPDYAAPVENPAGLFTVDLRPVATMALADEVPGDNTGGWSDEGPANDARALTPGRLSAYGVPFDLIDPKTNRQRAVVTLFGKNVTPTLPGQVTGISIHRRRVRALYFLHTAAWGVPGRLGHYTVHYADGSSLELPVVVGRNTGNWWSGYTRDEVSKPWPLRVPNTPDGQPAWRYLRVWEWENPRPEVEITTLDFVSARSVQTPILIAITGVTW